MKNADRGKLKDALRQDPCKCKPDPESRFVPSRFVSWCMCCDRELSVGELVHFRKGIVWCGRHRPTGNAWRVFPSKYVQRCDHPKCGLPIHLRHRIYWKSRTTCATCAEKSKT